MQLNLMDMVKSGKMSIDEAVNQARSGSEQKQRNLDLEVIYIDQELARKIIAKIELINI